MAIREKFDDLNYQKIRKKNLAIVNKVNRQFNLIRGKNINLSDVTNNLRKKLRNGEKIENIMPEALAVCKEAVRIATGNKIPYDVQTEAAIAMIEHGTIVEMQTGEGKTMVQILSAYLSALEATKSLDKSEWGSVHVLTSNDYLAKENAKQNEKVFELLGLSCSYTDRDLKAGKKREAYMCDVVYSTATNVAFDMLEDHNAKSKNEKYFQKKLSKAIVDEADDVLIDQALNPLVLVSSSGPNLDNETVDYLQWANRFVEGEIIPHKDGSPFPVDCYVEETRDNPLDKNRKLLDAKITRSTGEVTITDKLSEDIYNATKREFPKLNETELLRRSSLREYCVGEILKAKYLFKKDKDYSITNVKTQEVIKNPSEKVEAAITLINNNTGVFMFDSKYSGCMQTAIEIVEDYKAKKNPKCNYIIKKSKRPRVIGKNSYPNLIKAYDNVSGMTGTSNVESFREIYGFETYKIPTRKPSIRIDNEDEFYATKEEKYKAIVKEIIRCKKTLQPVLIGTTSVEESKRISELLAEEGIVHNLLNAENYKESAAIISTAGLLGSVTIATNMAGRGVDIQLGDGVKELGGLYVIGASKNNSERIDRQLRGRAARQGDPGCSKFFQSAQDDLVKHNANPKEFALFQEFAKNVANKLNSAVIKSKDIIKSIKHYQIKQESNDLARRISSESYNAPFTDVMNEFYGYRDKLLNAEKPVEINALMKETMEKLAFSLCNGIGFNEEQKDFDKNQIKVILDSINANVNVDDCFDLDPNKFSENLANALISRVSQSSNNEAKIKTKMLNTADDWWSYFLDSEEEMQKSFFLGQYGRSQDASPYKYKIELMSQYSIFSFNILLEQAAYIFNPSLEYGKYVVPDEQEIFKEEGVSLC